LAPADGYNITAFLVGALLFGLGLNFRLSKSSGPPREAAPAVPHSARAAAKSAPPQAGSKPGAPTRPGLLNTIVKGPADKKKTAPAPPKPPAAGGRSQAGKGGAGGQGQGKK
jgi:hypothetical protein